MAAVFALRIPFAVRRLRVLREIYDERGGVATLWAGRTFEVGLRLEGTGLLRLPYVALADRPAFAVAYLDGPLKADGAVGGPDALEIRYRVRCRGPGVARFEGVAVQVADYQGFFYHAAFVPGVVNYRVLPVLVDNGNATPTLKRDNQLPPPGVHRLRRPGSASELLDLRDYLPGDPPKTIAWKVSARRDRLVTKVFESEAPVRCTLFVDASNSVRVPTVHGSALGRIVDIAAAALQANSDARDLTGLCLFDEHDSKISRPDRSPAHVTRLLQTLADAAALAPAAARADPDLLIPLTYAFARQVYPDLMRPAVNDLPFWQEWFDSSPGYTRRKFSLINYLFRCKSAFAYAAIWLLPPTLLIADGIAAWITLTWYRATWSRLFSVLFYLDLGAALAIFAFVILYLIVTDRHRRLARYRKNVAAVLSVRYGLAPGGLSALLEDDEAFSLLAQRFLGEHQAPYTLPLYDRSGRYLFASPSKVGVLASALLRAVGRGRDNELFVLLADLLELDDSLDPLLKAVRVATSRHHQVMLIVPWPDGMRPPTEEPEEKEDWSGRLPALLGRAATRRFHRAYYRVRRTLARHGVQVVCAVGDEPVAADSATHEPAAHCGETTMTPNSTPEGSAQQPALTGYTILCLTSLMAIVLVFMENEADLTGVLLLAALGAIGVMTRWAAAPPLVLIGLAIVELYQRALERSFYRPAPGFTDVVLCAAVLAYCAGQYRLSSLKSTIFPVDARRRPAPKTGRLAPADSRQPRSAHLPQPWEAPVLAITAAAWAVGVLLFWLVLSVTPAPLNLPWRLWRVLLLIFAVGLAAAGLSAIVVYLSWIKATPTEHLLFLQDQAWRETRREKNKINRWLTWARLSRVRRKEKT